MNLLPSGLRLLLWLQVRGRIRKITQQARTPKGAVMSLFGVLLLVAWILPSVLAATLNHEPPNLELSRAVFPVALLMFTLLGVFSSAGERALYFTPSEIEFLFQAPYTRRQVLTYRILSRNLSLFFVALIFSVFLMRACELWLAAYVGALLGLVFLNLMATIIALLSEYIAEYTYSRVRKVIVAVVVAVVVFGFVRGMNLSRSDDLLALVVRLTEHPAARVILAPFQPLTQTFTAASYGDLLFWAPIALAMNAAIFFVVVMLDSHYEDTAVAISEKLYARGQRTKAAGGLAVRAKSARFSLPQLPRLGGAGVIVWMQLTHAFRAGRTLAIIALPMVFMIAALFYLGEKTEGDSSAVGSTAGIMCVYLSFFFPNVFRFDFRGHIDNMDALKAMPFSALAVTIGELITPVAVTAGIQAILLGCAAVLSDGMSPLWALVLVALFPINLLLYGVENLVFLLYPVRLATTGPGDMQFLGRQVMLIFVKFFLLAIAFGVAALFGAVIYAFAGMQIVLIGAVAVAVLTVMSICFVPIVAEAYRRFDPSQHMPA